MPDHSGKGLVLPGLWGNQDLGCVVSLPPTNSPLLPEPGCAVGQEASWHLQPLTQLSLQAAPSLLDKECEGQHITHLAPSQRRRQMIGDQGEGAVCTSREES